MVTMSIMRILTSFSITMTQEAKKRAHDAETISQIEDARTAYEAFIADLAGDDSAPGDMYIGFTPKWH